MDELSKEYIISFFNKSLQLHGDNPESLRWSRAGRYLHYKALLDVNMDMRGKKILDYGCGKGDFYTFLLSEGIETNYTGFDINENLIIHARNELPQCRFKVFDIELEELTEDFDFIFLCGVFNLKVKGIEETVRIVLKKLFNQCKSALIFNALSIHNPNKDFELSYLSPEDMFGFAVSNLSPFLSLRHDRLNYDFSLFVYKALNNP